MNLAKDVQVMYKIKYKTPLKVKKKICTNEKHAIDSSRKIQYLGERTYKFNTI